MAQADDPANRCAVRGPVTIESVDSLPFAVVDVETTGFSPRLHDRIVEIAIVRVTRAGDVEDEYATLVNPLRDVGATHVHGITATDVRDAPTYVVQVLLGHSILVGDGQVASRRP